MILRALLLLALVMSLLFAWRAWTAFPGLAKLAVALAAVFLILVTILQPSLGLVGLAAAVVLAAHLRKR